MFNKIIDFYYKLVKIRFVRYVIAGAGATIIDWGSFYLLAVVFQLHYQFSLIISFTLGTAANYTLNKLFTFQCQSKKIAAQFSVHLGVAAISLGLSSLIMFYLVEIILFSKIFARVITTFIMLIVNYLIIKKTTFNQRFFK